MKFKNFPIVFTNKMVLLLFHKQRQTTGTEIKAVLQADLQLTTILLQGQDPSSQVAVKCRCKPIKQLVAQKYRRGKVRVVQTCIKS